jgi:hypothetical protein
MVAEVAGSRVRVRAVQVTVGCGFSGDAATKAATPGATEGQRSTDFEPSTAPRGDELGAEANVGGEPPPGRHTG